MQSRSWPKTLSMVLAGGQGSRLAPLTDERAKPAVPFGGHYRLIDFPLSNLVNAGFQKIVVLTQYKSHSLDIHISRAWSLSPMLDSWVATAPAQMRNGPQWFLGSADALFQNLNIIGDERPKHVFVFGADNIYRIDPRQMLEQHIESGAGVTVAALRVPKEESESFGVIDYGAGTKISRFLEKPSVEETTGLASDPNMILASMGNYIFDVDVLVDLLHQDAADAASNRDVGGNLIPGLVDAGQAHFYDFTTNQVPGQDPGAHYWRDVGTLDSYYDAHMDLVAEVPKFDLYNPDWPIHTLARNLPPAKLINDSRSRSSQVRRSLLSNGVVVSGAKVGDSVLSPGAYIDSRAEVTNSILLDNVHVGAGARIRNAVIDKNCVIPPGAYIGWDQEYDREHFVVSENGVVVIAKGTDLSRLPRIRVQRLKPAVPTLAAVKV